MPLVFKDGKPVPQSLSLKSTTSSAPKTESTAPTSVGSAPTESSKSGQSAAVSDTPTAKPQNNASTIATSFQRLIATASKLNEASDELTATVSRLDAALKKINLGVPAWVDIKNETNDENEFLQERIGYLRIGARWGVALNTVQGFQGDDPRNFDDNLWLFTDATRELRLRAVEYIPELIEELDRAANKVAKRVVSKIKEVDELTSAIEAQTGGSK
jgi:hypothetical protein